MGTRVAEGGIAAVIPAHNQAQLLPRALASVAAQTSAPDEIIVVDDASSDATALAASSFARQRGTVIRLLRRDTPGPGGYAARNLAIASTSCAWVAFLDADDVWRPDHLAQTRVLLAQARGDLVALFAARMLCLPDGRTRLQTATDAPFAQLLDFDGFLALWLRLRRCPMWTSATVLRREAAVAAGLFPAERCRRGGDKDLWLRVMTEGVGLASLHIGAEYRLDVPGQVTRSEAFSGQHCLCRTVEALGRAAPTSRRRLLRQVQNLEVFAYARRAFGREPASRQALQDFDAASDPARYLLLHAMVRTPAPLRRLIRRRLA